MPRDPLSLISLSLSNAHDARWRAYQAMFTMLDGEHIKQCSRCSMVSMSSNVHDARWRVCRAMLTILDGEHVEQYLAAYISTHDVSILEYCAQLLQSFVAKLSNLRIVKLCLSLLTLLILYSLFYNKYFFRPVILEQHLSI